MMSHDLLVQMTSSINITAMEMATRLFLNKLQAYSSK